MSLIIQSDRDCAVWTHASALTSFAHDIITAVASVYLC